MDTEMAMDSAIDSAVIMDNAMVPAPDTPMDDEPTSPETQQPSKRRRKKSVVWEHFTVETIGPGHTRACCKQCKKSFAYINGPKLAGTSHLKRHIALGICPAGRQNGELSPYTAVTSSGGYANATDPPKKRRYRITPPPIPSSPLDQERCSQEVAKMIILHEYPLHIVEHPGFIDLVRTLQPQYNLVSFNTIQGDCVGIYLKEKQKLLDLISTIPGHVNLTLDVWTSNQTLGYVFLSGHFIDSEWKVHRHLLNVVMVSEPDSEHAFNQAVVACISDWSLDSGLFTLTLDETASSGSAIGNLRGLLCVKNPLVINGQLVVGSCFARVLSRVAQEAIGSLQGTVNKIRDSVKYVKTSEANDEKFDELKQHLQVPSTKELCVDDRNKWNTTYNMLVAALELKEVFAYFDASDPSYKLSPSMDDWKQVETLCSYLKLFYDAACTLTSAVPPTANIFFHEVSKIHLELAHAVTSQDPFVSNLVRPLHEKFDKYWRDSCLVLGIAVVMDPRFKMKLVEFNFQRIYGDDAESWIRLVEDGIHELYQDYSSPMLTHHQHQHQHQHHEHDHAGAPSSEKEDEEGIVKAEPPEIPPQEGMSSHEEEQQMIPSAQEEEGEEGTTLITFGDGLSDFDVYISEITGGQETRSELDQYLEESLLPRVQEFDVLTWWKLNNVKYPTLSKMAADVLSIPMCSVPPEYVFDTKGRHIDSYRSSLRPVTLEALICTRDWLLHGC